jgi:hypothetical protein
MGNFFNRVAGAELAEAAADATYMRERMQAGATAEEATAGLLRWRAEHGHPVLDEAVRQNAADAAAMGLPRVSVIVR